VTSQFRDDARVILIRDVSSTVPDVSDTPGAETDDQAVGDPERSPPEPGEEDEGDGVFGEAVPAVPVEPGTPSIEHAAFVLLGVASTVALVFHLVSLLN
jgi:hypothetical protein